MQFKHPDLLYALLLLIIPIIIHLFQLRRFQKVEFTNVQFLKDITVQTRKSSQIKKWLTLLTRLLLLACIIIAFAQPYLSNSDNFNTKSETVIYLDNSFSMQAKSSNGTLLNKAVQDMIGNLDENEKITIFTNDHTFKNTTAKAIKNDLIQLKHSPSQLDYEAVLLKGKQEFSKDPSSIKNLVLISDFQQKSEALKISNGNKGINYKLVQLKPETTQNVTIDSVYISKIAIENIEVTVSLKNQGDDIETLPISLYNGDKLIAKSAVSIVDQASTVFTIPTVTSFDGKLVIEDANLQYDNILNFNINQRDHIKVFSINETDDAFLKKIYTDDEFDYQSTPFAELNYNLLQTQNLIILNELKSIPNSLITTLKSFSNDGGTVLIIPSNEITLDSYNQLFNKFLLPPFSFKNTSEKLVTTINFSHPLLSNVFDEKVSNFQYPKVNSYYPIHPPSGASILKYEDGNSFLMQSKQLFVFSSALNEKNSNFKNSPLIVPVLYNIGKQSLKFPKLYYTIGKENKIDIAITIQQDDILTLVVNEEAIVPLQHSYANKVELTTNEYPQTAGIFEVRNKEKPLLKLSYNYERNESDLSYLNLKEVTQADIVNSIESALLEIKSNGNVNELWKWFAIFAIAFLLIEMLILKFFK